LEEHDAIVLQHPFFWYSTPALIKEWLDLVLEHGWAYGSQGTKLKGKRVLNAITTEGSETAYKRGGHHQFTVREFLAPVEQTFKLCGMEYLPPFVVDGTHGMSVEEMKSQAQGYQRVVEALRDDQLDVQAMHNDPYREWHLRELLPGGKEST